MRGKSATSRSSAAASGSGNRRDIGDDDDNSDDEILLVASPAPRPRAEARGPFEPGQKVLKKTAKKARRRCEGSADLPQKRTSVGDPARIADRTAKRRKTLAEAPPAPSTFSSGDRSALESPARRVGTSSAKTSRTAIPGGGAQSRTQTVPAPSTSRSRSLKSDSSGSTERRSAQVPTPQKADRDRVPSVTPATSPRKKRARSPGFEITIPFRLPDSPRKRKNSTASKAGRLSEPLPSSSASLPPPPKMLTPSQPTLSPEENGATPDTTTVRAKAKGRLRARVSAPAQPFDLIVPVSKPARISAPASGLNGRSRLSTEVRKTPQPSAPSPPALAFPDKPASHPLNSLRIRPPPHIAPVLPIHRICNDDFEPVVELGGWVEPYTGPPGSKGKLRTTMTAARSREETPVAVAVAPAPPGPSPMRSLAAPAKSGARLLSPPPAPSVAPPAVHRPLRRSPSPEPSFDDWIDQRYGFLSPKQTSHYKIDGTAFGTDPDVLSFEWDEEELWDAYEETWGWEERERVELGQLEDSEEDSDYSDARDDEDGEDGSMAGRSPPLRPKMACTLRAGKKLITGTEAIATLCHLSSASAGAVSEDMRSVASQQLAGWVQTSGLVRQYPWRWQSLDEAKGRANNERTNWATPNPYVREGDEEETGRGARGKARAAVAQKSLRAGLPPNDVLTSPRGSSSSSYAGSASKNGDAFVERSGSRSATTSRSGSPILEPAFTDLLQASIARAHRALVRQAAAPRPEEVPSRDRPLALSAGSDPRAGTVGSVPCAPFGTSGLESSRSFPSYPPMGGAKGKNRAVEPSEVDFFIADRSAELDSTRGLVCGVGGW
ncbi:hypothetical protein JCM8202_002611 [Rhodotorula sphaerocarpa]